MARNLLVVAGAVISLGAAWSFTAHAATTSPDSHGSSPASTSASQSTHGSGRDSKYTSRGAGGKTTPSTETRSADATTNTTNAAPAVREMRETKPARTPVVAENTKPTADEALDRLVEGNFRWASNDGTNPRTESSRREDTASNGQFPFATVVTCADSRIPVERVFDQGVGDLFVVRVAGNVASKSSEVGTIEYGVGHLHTPVLVVMGHTKCGAVGAACSGAHLEGNVGDLVSNIYPAVERAKRNNPGAKEAALIDAAIHENVWQTIFDLYRNSPECRKLVKSGELKVVGAVYDIASGKVEWMGEHPWNMELAGAWEDQSNTPTQRTVSRTGTTADADDHSDEKDTTPTTHDSKPETQVSVPTDDDDHGHGHGH